MQDACRTARSDGEETLQNRRMSINLNVIGDDFQPLMSVKIRGSIDECDRYVALMQFPNGDCLVSRRSDLTTDLRGLIAWRASRGILEPDPPHELVEYGGKIPAELAQGIS